jgi:hypothetical protein
MGIAVDPMPRKALIGALTILINLYQNCFAPFGYAEDIASKGHCRRSHCVQRTLHPKDIAPEGYCWRSHCVQRKLRPKDIAGEAIASEGHCAAGIAPQALRPKDIAPQALITETPSY